MVICRIVQTSMRPAFTHPIVTLPHRNNVVGHFFFLLNWMTSRSTKEGINQRTDAYRNDAKIIIRKNR